MQINSLERPIVKLVLIKPLTKDLFESVNIDFHLNVFVIKFITYI